MKKVNTSKEVRPELKTVETAKPIYEPLPEERPKPNKKFGKNARRKIVLGPNGEDGCWTPEEWHQIKQIREEKIENNIKTTLKKYHDHALEVGPRKVFFDLATEYFPIKLIPGGAPDSIEERKSELHIKKFNPEELLQRNAKNMLDIYNDDKMQALYDVGRYQEVIDLGWQLDYRTRVEQTNILQSSKSPETKEDLQKILSEGRCSLIDAIADKLC